MLSKGLKKFKDRIFSGSRKEGSQSGTDYSEGPESPGNLSSPRNTLRNLSSVRSKNSSYADRELAASSSARSNGSVGPQTITLKESPMLSDHNGSSSGGAAVLPPVQINTNQTSFTAKGQQAPNLASMLSHSSGRRKSTPAALDMALRTAEGKAAVEHLLQPGAGQNKLVFGNYFAGTSAAARDQAVAIAAAEKQRAKAAAAAATTAAAAPAGQLLSPRPPLGRPPSLTLPSRKGSASSMHPHANDSGSMATVPEDVVMSEASTQHAAAPPGSARKHHHASPSSTTEGYHQPPSPSGGHKAHHSPSHTSPTAASAAAAAAQQPTLYQHHQHHQPQTQPPQPQQLPQMHHHSAPQAPQLAAAPAASSPTAHSQSQPQLQPQQLQSHAQPLRPTALGAPAEETSTSSSPVGRQTASKLISLSPQLPSAMQRKYWMLSDYNIIRKMYTGYASTVYQAMCKKSLEMVALKVYHMQNLCELNHYQVFREVRVHSSLQHQNIIHLYAAFQEGTDVVLVQEYAEGGDLYRLLHKNGGRLSERQAVEMVLHPFLLALHYLHTRGIMHRDIKPENVLFTEHRVLKLADFGLAIDLNEERAVTRAGTLDYMAPEVLRCPPKNLPQENKNNPYLHYNNSVDAWAVGVFAYELIVGFPPFAGETQLDSVDRIMHSVPEFPGKISEFAKDFICQCLRKHPGDRPTVMELLHHPWVRTFQRRTSMRITTMPRRRSSVVLNPGSLTNHPGGGLHESGPYAAAPHEAAEEGGDGDAVPMDTDVNEMTPEQIEQMILKLQVAKANALAKSGSSSKRVSTDVPMQAVHSVHSVQI